MENVVTFDDLEQEFNEKQAAVMTQFWQFLDEMKKLRAELNELEQQPMYGGGIWIKDGKYAYKIYTPPGKKRVREYYGKDIDSLRREQENYRRHTELSALYAEQLGKLRVARRKFDELSQLFDW